jgi:CubicO group peptidase (beta-lactamase class C family)
MVSHQTPRSKETYGFGWRVTPGGFGRACSERTYGHSGSTGTMCWLDPARDLSFVLLTTRPLADSGPRLLRPVSDLVSESA